MEKKLTKHGNSYALVIDKPILELMGIDSESVLSLKLNGRTLEVSPANKSRRRKQFTDAVAEAHMKYGKGFKKLSE